MEIESFIRTRELVEHCNGYEEARWADWKNGDKTGLTVERFAKELRQHFKLRSSRIWHQDKDVHGYWLKPFQELFDSYLPPENDEPKPPSGGPSAAGQNSAESEPTDSAEQEDTPFPPKKRHGPHGD